MRRAQLGVLAIAVILGCAFFILRNRGTKAGDRGGKVSGPAPAAREAPVSADAASVPAEASRRPPAARDGGARETAARIAELFGAIQERHRTGRRKHTGPAGPGDLTRFERECMFGLREARLLALAYPEEAEKLARESLGPEKPKEDLQLAFYVLHILAKEAGRSGALGLLKEHASGPDTPLSRAALRHLGMTDATGEFLPLYWRKCGENVPESLEAMSFWPNPASIVSLKGYLDRNNSGASPGFLYSQRAKDALENIEILMEPGHKRLEALLGDPIANYKTAWAVRAARQMNYPGLKDILRARLDKGRQAYERQSPEDVESVYAPYISALEDGDYDEVLVAYHQMGGQLSAWERERLHYFGYGCDPRERLMQLVQ